MLIIIEIIVVFTIGILLILFSSTSLNNLFISINEISKGNLNFKVEATGNGEISKAINRLNDMKASFDMAVKEQLKSEKLKTELVSNVSHDLKTPLTSIINYINLLQRENLTEEEKGDYLKILSNKSQKLKVLIEDLFEASKINSGKVQLELEQIDEVQLINQGLGELSGFYSDKNLKFVIKSFESKVFLNLDGKKMSRVFENLISNAIKYSLENTRIYIDILSGREEIIISFKNISSVELDFDAEEIFERFKRGDKSRNSTIEGSGLGLSIAKGIVEIHGGKMSIETEGDLFKVFVIFKL